MWPWDRIHIFCAIIRIKRKTLFSTNPDWWALNWKEWFFFFFPFVFCFSAITHTLNHLKPHTSTFHPQIATRPFFNCIHFYLSPTGPATAVVTVICLLWQGERGAPKPLSTPSWSVRLITQPSDLEVTSSTESVTFHGRCKSIHLCQASASILAFTKLAYWSRGNAWVRISCFFCFLKTSSGSPACTSDCPLLTWIWSETLFFTVLNRFGVFVEWKTPIIVMDVVINDLYWSLMSYPLWNQLLRGFWYIGSQLVFCSHWLVLLCDHSWTILTTSTWVSFHASVQMRACSTQVWIEVKISQLPERKHNLRVCFGTGCVFESSSEEFVWLL